MKIFILEKIYKTFLISIILLFLLCCSDDEELKSTPTSGRDCSSGNIITFNNVSPNTVNRLYMHDKPDFIEGTTSAELLVSNLISKNTIDYNFLAGTTKYFTFIRNFSSTIQTEIAITTSQPILLSDCHRYNLLLLEEDFFLETSEF